MNDKSHGKQFATRMSDSVREQLLQAQAECTFIWQGEREPIGTVMSFLWDDGCLWLTTNEARPRIAALRRTPRACAVISSAGTALGQSRCVTVRGPCRVLADRETAQWFYPRFCRKLFPDNARAQAAMHDLLDRPGQVILQLVPEHWTAYDGDALMARLAAL